jgi:hypothetical protein
LNIYKSSKWRSWQETLSIHLFKVENQ